MSPVTASLAAFLIVNALTFAQFGIDKHRAVHGGWRVRESSLLGLAFVGGTPAAYLARRMLRHKTRKQPFSNILATIAMVQTGVVLGLGIAFI